MLIEAGRIVALAEDCMWLDMEARPVRCATCRGRCGFAFIARRCPAERRLCVPLPPGGASSLAIGQRVEVGLLTAPLLGAALLTYFLPLLGFFVGLLLSSHWFPDGGEGLALSVGLIGLVAGVLLARSACRRRLAEPPQLLRILPDNAEATTTATVGSVSAPLASDS